MILTSVLLFAEQQLGLFLLIHLPVQLLQPLTLQTLEVLYLSLMLELR